MFLLIGDKITKKFINRQILGTISEKRGKLKWKIK